MNYQQISEKLEHENKLDRLYKRFGVPYFLLEQLDRAVRFIKWHNKNLSNYKQLDINFKAGNRYEMEFLKNTKEEREISLQIISNFLVRAKENNVDGQAVLDELGYQVLEQ